MTPLEILKQARALIEKPENWNQKCYRDGDVYDCDGAIAAAAGLEVEMYSMELPEFSTSDRGAPYYKARELVARTQLETMNHLVTAPASEIQTYCLACWEGVTHEDVLALFDRAIEECVSQTTDDMFEVEPKARTFHKGVVRLVDRSTDYIDECKSNGDLK